MLCTVRPVTAKRTTCPAGDNMQQDRHPTNVALCNIPRYVWARTTKRHSEICIGYGTLTRVHDVKIRRLRTSTRNANNVTRKKLE